MFQFLRDILEIFLFKITNRTIFFTRDIGIFLWIGRIIVLSIKLARDSITRIIIIRMIRCNEFRSSERHARK